MGWLNQFVEALAWRNRGARIRPQYAWGVAMAAAQAKALGHGDVSVLEFGVAGGRGLLAMQDIAAEISRRFQVRVHVAGFDTGTGLPAVGDPRDLPQLYSGGNYAMEQQALQEKLDHATTSLVIGPIRETLGRFLATAPAVIGFVSVDVDLYSSTVDALSVFRGTAAITHCLPRVVVYLDDSMGLTFGDLTGERLAVAEYNAQSAPHRGIFPVYGLRYHIGWPHSRAQWPDMMYWAHFLDHPQTGASDGLSPVRHAPL